MTDEQIILEELQKRFHLKELRVPVNNHNIPPTVICTALCAGVNGDYKVAFSYLDKLATFSFNDIVELVEFFQELQFEVISDKTVEYNELFNNMLKIKKLWKI